VTEKVYPDDFRPLMLDEKQARRVDFLEKRFASYLIRAKRMSEDDGCRAVPMHVFLDGYGKMDRIEDERVRYLAIWAADAHMAICGACGELAPLTNMHGICRWGCTPKIAEPAG
jgi:hypothetical protein